MKKIILITMCIFVLCACSISKPIINGNFEGRYSIYGNVQLKLYPDSSFVLQAGRVPYPGKWHNENTGEISLDFDEIKGIKHFISPLVNTEKRNIKVINQNKIQYDEHTVLKRVK